MADKILVTYATRAGSTVGVAEAIGQTLTDCGLQVEVRPMTEIKDLTPYRAVVAGSAIQESQWLPEALQFVKTHQATLQQKPFAAFLVCIAMSSKNTRYHAGVADWLKPVRQMVKPASEGYFAGALDFSKLPRNLKTMLMRVVVMTGFWKEGDFRDWQAIRAWAEALPAQLKL